MTERNMKDTDSRRSPKIGEIYKGKVIKILHFGAFIDFGFPKDGLVHISEISEKRIPDVESELAVGQDVSVKMIGFNDKGSPKLSIKRALDSFVQKDPPEEGEIYDGVVKSIQKFGAFIDFGFERDGLVHISEIAEEHIENVESELSVEQDIKVRFMGFDDGGRFQLSIKRV